MLRRAPVFVAREIRGSPAAQVRARGASRRRVAAAHRARARARRDAQEPARRRGRRRGGTSSGASSTPKRSRKAFERRRARPFVRREVVGTRDRRASRFERMPQVVAALDRAGGLAELAEAAPTLEGLEVALRDALSRVGRPARFSFRVVSTPSPRNAFGPSPRRRLVSPRNDPRVGAAAPGDDATSFSCSPAGSPAAGTRARVDLVSNENGARLG